MGGRASVPLVLCATCQFPRQRGHLQRLLLDPLPHLVRYDAVCFPLDCSFLKLLAELVLGGSKPPLRHLRVFSHLFSPRVVELEIVPAVERERGASCDSPNRFVFWAGIRATLPSSQARPF